MDESSKTQHTPGPWSYAEWRETHGGEVVACGWDILAGGHQLPLCHQTGDADEAEANVRLAASAPELFDALRWALGAMAARNPVWTEGDNYIKARAAVAKATGEQQ